MQDHVKAVLLCSTGLCISYGGSSILVDALNGAFPGFKVIPEETARQIIHGEPPFDQVAGLFYSHRHPDHFHPENNDAFLTRHPGVISLLPTEKTPDHGVLQAGPFTVEYQYLEHMPCSYAWVKHYVLLITVNGVSIYLTTDASLQPEAHRAFLNGRRADYAFWNALYLSYPETRRLLADSAGKNWIYHMPEPQTDRTGICRKAERNLLRYPEELRGVEVLERYPTEMVLYPIL